MSEPIKPALTAEQWEEFENTSVVHFPNGVSISDARWGWTDTPRHAEAALALYGQPFGFTREMVDALRVVMRNFDGVDIESGEYVGDEMRPLVEALATNLEALLPPEGK